MKATLSILCAACFEGVLATSPAAAQQAGAKIMMTDAFRFEPSEVRIRAGETVEWRNASRFPHTVTDDPKLGDAAIPAGAKAFLSAEIAPGGTYRLVLSVPGHYRYLCTLHEGIGMVGEITVLPR